jgi:hypothetical protein
MKKKTVLLTAYMLISGMFVSVSNGEGLPISKYMEDPEHTNDIIGYYLNAFMSGITLANEKAMPKLFCVPEAVAAQGIYVMIDRRIANLQKQKKISNDMSVDSIIMDMLVEEFPCN